MPTVAGMSTQPFSRPQHSKVLAGVCAGLARRFEVSTTLVRAIFVAFLILPGSSVLAYLVLWLVMPKDRGEDAAAGTGAPGGAPMA